MILSGELGERTSSPVGGAHLKSYSFIQRASDTKDVFGSDMCVDHGGLEFLMAEQLLNRPDIISIL